MRGLAAALAVVVAGAGPGSAQGVLGPGRCVGCHEHADPARKWQIEEPARLGSRAHFGTLGRLEDRRASTLARAIGLTSPYATEGACVRCHATVFRSRANAGVSCESCHGPGRGYIELHQEKASHERSVAAGLRDLRGRPDAIARLCVSCHAVDDRRLVEAGHPSGASFDAGAGLGQIVHWTASYDHARVTAAARAAMPSRPNEPSPARSTTSAPNGGVVTPSNAPRSGGPAPHAGPDRWEAARPLPPAYVPDAASDPSTRTRPSLSPAAPEPLPVASIAEEMVPPPPSRLRTDLAAAPTRSANQHLEVRNETLLLLARLLVAGVRLPPGETVPSPEEHEGPDGELQRLQDEIHALALRALQSPRP